MADRIGFGMASRAGSADIWTGERDATLAVLHVREAIGELRHHAPLVALWVAACLAVGIGSLAVAPRNYVATTRILLQPRVLVTDGPEQVRATQQEVLDEEQAETEMHMLRSQRLLSRVFDGLALAAAPELQGDAGGVWAALGHAVDRLASGTRSAVPARQAFARFAARVRIRRQNLSHVIAIDYTSSDPALAARVANAVAASYLNDRIADMLGEAQIGMPYLRGRIGQMQRELMLTAQAAAGGPADLGILPDARALPLGPASAPLASVYPRSGPTLMLALAIGVVAAGLWIVVGTQWDRTIRSPAQLRRRFGLDSTVLTLDRSPVRRLPAGDARGAASVGRCAATLAAVAGTAPVTLGLLACSAGAAGTRVAAALADGLAASGRPSRVVGPVERAAGVAPASPDPAITLMILPRRPDDLAPGPAPSGVVLIVEAHRTAASEVRWSLAAIAAGSAPLRAVIVLRDPDAVSRFRLPLRPATPRPSMA